MRYATKSKFTFDFPVINSCLRFLRSSRSMCAIAAVLSIIRIILHQGMRPPVCDETLHQVGIRANSMPGWISGDCGLTLTPYRLGSLGGKREKGDHFTLDVVTNSQEEKCGLKYVI